MIINQNKDLYNADIYLRLSKEDGDKEESDSIINQKELILDFLKAKTDIKVHAIRIDDGYSGVNFERPAFQEMLEDIKKGIVNCVITKDLSRFGRNHIEAGGTSRRPSRLLASVLLPLMTIMTAQREICRRQISLFPLKI